VNTYTTPNISCPTCRSVHVRKAEYEGVIEQAILRIANICPFECHACGIRFYLFLVESLTPRPESPRAWLYSKQGKIVASSN
jgi:hypothetical protein